MRDLAHAGAVAFSDDAHSTGWKCSAAHWNTPTACPIPLSPPIGIGPERPFANARGHHEHAHGRGGIQRPRKPFASNATSTFCDTPAANCTFRISSAESVQLIRRRKAKDCPSHAPLLRTTSFLGRRPQHLRWHLKNTAAFPGKSRPSSTLPRRVDGTIDALISDHRPKTLSTTTWNSCSPPTAWQELNRCSRCPCGAVGCFGRAQCHHSGITAGPRAALD